MKSPDLWSVGFVAGRLPGATHVFVGSADLAIRAAMALERAGLLEEVAVVLDPDKPARSWTWLNAATLPEDPLWTPRTVKWDTLPDGSLRFSLPEGAARA